MSNVTEALICRRSRLLPALALALSTGASLASESLATRATLLGDWNGARQSLSDHGVNAQLEFTGYYQGMFSGDGNDDAEPAGRVDAFLDFDTGKLGLWKGGSLRANIVF